MKSRMNWRKGAPNEPGIWIVEESTRDLAVWEVTMDVAEDPDNWPEEDLGKKYLRFNDGQTSEPIDGYPCPPRQCLGPFKSPSGIKTSVTNQKGRD